MPEVVHDWLALLFWGPRRGGTPWWRTWWNVLSSHRWDLEKRKRRNTTLWWAYVAEDAVPHDVWEAEREREIQRDVLLQGMSPET